MNITRHDCIIALLSIYYSCKRSAYTEQQQQLLQQDVDDDAQYMMQTSNE